ncbi:MAG: D-alanyl-D-alanine carboxypeptidase family protein [Actinomycetes bacterium]
MSPGSRGRARARRLAAGVLAAACALVVAPGAGDRLVPVAEARSLADPADLPVPPQPVLPVVPPAWPELPAVDGDAVLLLDADTGQVLGERGADVRRPVASTVKLLTALTVLRRAEPDDEVTIGSEVVGIGGAGVGLRPGDTWTVEELLTGLLVRSGNDAAVALAVHVGGSVPGFAALLLADATELGLTGVSLVSPSGLDDANRMSARDLGTVARAALDEPTIARIVASERVTLPGRRSEPNRNELVGRYPGATGLKTGFTDAAGYALVASAERDGRRLVAVVLGADSEDSRFDAAERLLDHGFGAFSRSDVDVALSLRVAGADVAVTSGTAPLTLPLVDPRPSVEGFLPVEVPRVDVDLELGVGWGQTVLATVPLDVATDPRPPASGGEAAGRWVGDRLHASLRAATRAGLWDSAPDVGG